MRTFTLAFLTVTLSMSAFGAVKTETVTYKDGDTTCKGFLAYDDKIEGKRPVVLIVHEWWGVGDFVKKNAERLAEAGYLAFAVDMYGDGFYTETVEEAAARSGEMKGDPEKSKARFGAAMAAAMARPEADPAKVAAIGYCFGGTTVLNVARLGAELKGVVSFHGGLATAVPASTEKPKAAILVCHGNDDPFVKADEVKAFKEEMGKRRALLNFIGYPGTVHSFTNPDVDRHNLDGAKYNKAADEHSWKEMLTFLKKVFA